MGVLRIIRQIFLRGGQPRCFIRMLVELQFYTFHFHTDIPSCEAAPALPAHRSTSSLKLNLEMNYSNLIVL